MDHEKIEQMGRLGGAKHDLPPLPESYDLIQALGIPAADWDRTGYPARRIIWELIPEFARAFAEASIHYGSNNANVLGPAGQFADIWRKIGPLKRALWDGQKLTRESPEEICMDLIGHLMLTIDMLRKGMDLHGTGRDL